MSTLPWSLNVESIHERSGGKWDNHRHIVSQAPLNYFCLTATLLNIEVVNFNVPNMDIKLQNLNTDVIGALNPKIEYLEISING